MVFNRESHSGATTARPQSSPAPLGRRQDVPASKCLSVLLRVHSWLKNLRWPDTFSCQFRAGGADWLRDTGSAVHEDEQGFTTYGTGGRKEPTMNSRLSYSILIICGVLLAQTGCRDEKREAIKAAILTNYIAFRSALAAGDIERAKPFVASEFLASLPPEWIVKTFGDLTNARFEPNSDLYIDYRGRLANSVWFFPQGSTNGAVAEEFMFESNFWKLTGDFMDVRD